MCPRLNAMDKFSFEAKQVWNSWNEPIQQATVLQEATNSVLNP